MKKKATLLSISKDQFIKIQNKATENTGKGNKKKGLLL